MIDTGGSQRVIGFFVDETPFARDQCRGNGAFLAAYGLRDTGRQIIAVPVQTGTPSQFRRQSYGFKNDDTPGNRAYRSDAVEEGVTRKVVAAGTDRGRRGHQSDGGLDPVSRNGHFTPRAHADPERDPLELPSCDRERAKEKPGASRPRIDALDQSLHRTASFFGQDGSIGPHHADDGGEKTRRDGGRKPRCRAQQSRTAESDGRQKGSETENGDRFGSGLGRQREIDENAQHHRRCKPEEGSPRLSFDLDPVPQPLGPGGRHATETRAKGIRPEVFRTSRSDHRARP